MKTLVFSTMTLVGMLLVGLQHHQLSELRAENAALAQASTEATRLRQELATAAGNTAPDDAELERLRQQNDDLLKLRNEINQLREARAEFDKATAENQRLKALARTTAKSVNTDGAMRPILVPIAQLSNRGLATPEDALLTFFWAERDNDLATVIQCLTPKLAATVGRNFQMDPQRFSYFNSVEIVARNSVNSTTIQLGVRIHTKGGPTMDQMTIIQLVLFGAEWKLDMNDF